MALFELLSLDTMLFGIKVAKIIPSCLSSQQLKILLVQLKEQGIKLVYWCTDHKDAEIQKAAQDFHGFLADEKITYITNLETLSSVLKSKTWQCYEAQEANSSLIKLAFESGKFSRFLKDPRIGHDRFEAIYTQWIQNSCNHSIAEGVIIIKEKNTLVGMVTVGLKNQRGDIGLLAVSPEHLRKGYGSQLVKMAQAYFSNKEIHHVQVVTQKANLAACQLYEKNGFIIESIQNFYHFWI